MATYLSGGSPLSDRLKAMAGCVCTGCSLIGYLTFVSSDESKGWVFVEDLPADKRRALYDRIGIGFQTY
jgi:hypothetical protein